MFTQSKYRYLHMSPQKTIYNNEELEYTMTDRFSWNDYVQNTLLGSGYVSKAAIFGLEPVQKWASSDGFEVTTNEAKLLIKSFTEPELIRWEGISLNESQFTCMKVDSGHIMGKTGNSGCIICLCRRMLLISVYEEGIHPGQCYNLTLKLAEYLRNEGF